MPEVMKVKMAKTTMMELPIFLSTDLIVFANAMAQVKNKVKKTIAWTAGAVALTVVSA